MKSPSSKARKQKPAKSPKASPQKEEFSAGFLLFRMAPTKHGQPTRLWLLLDYGKHWDYPKGHLEKSETPWQAAVRELREETGIRQVDRRTNYRQQMQYAFYSSRKGHIKKTVTYFVGETRTEKVSLSDEHTGYAWLPYEQAMDTLTFENARELLATAEQTLQAQAK